MFLAEHDGAGWSEGSLRGYGALALDPAAQVLNYGQSVFEGLKAQRSAADARRAVLFRPAANAARMRDGAARLVMPPPPEALFLRAVAEVTRANGAMVPPLGQGSLYLRPLLIGSGPIVGLGPAPSFTFVCFATAVGGYFKGGQLDPIDLVVETRFHRAAPGGMGGTKAAGNYSPVLLTQLQAKAEGYADVVYRDALTDTFLEEVSSCNIFVVRGRRVSTPSLRGTILPGVTRRSVLELLSRGGYEVVEEDVATSDALAADEVFTTGTAVVVSAVGSLTLEGERHQIGKAGEAGPVTMWVYDTLTGIQSERLPDEHGWVYPV